MSSEVYSYVMELLFEAGALDVYYTPIYMKKNRPATKVSVLCQQKDEKNLCQILFKETTTLGIRKQKVQRETLTRQFVSIPTPFGLCTMKVSTYGDTMVKALPEYEECKVIAQAKGIPLKDVYDTIRLAWKEQEDENKG